MFVNSEYTLLRSYSAEQKAPLLQSCSDRKYLVVDTKNMLVSLTTDKKLSSSVKKVCQFYQNHSHLMNAKSLEIFAFSSTESNKAELVKKIKMDAFKKILKEKIAVFKEIKFKSNDLTNKINNLKIEKQNLCEKKVSLEKNLSDNLDFQISLMDQIDVLAEKKRQFSQDLKKLNLTEEDIKLKEEQIRLKLKKIRNLKKDLKKVENVNINIKNEIYQIELSLPKLHHQIVLLKNSLNSTKEKIVRMDSYFRDLLGDGHLELNIVQFNASIKKTLREFFCHTKNTQENVRNTLMDKLKLIKNQTVVDLIHYMLSLENVNVEIVKKYEGFDVSDIQEDLSQDTIDYLHLESLLVIQDEDLIGAKKSEEMDEFFLQHPQMLAEIYRLMEKTSITSFNRSADVLFIDRGEKEDVEFKTKTIFADRIDSSKTINKIKGFSERSQDRKTLKHHLDTQIGHQLLSSKEMTLSLLNTNIHNVDFIKLHQAIKNYLIEHYLKDKKSAADTYNNFFQKKAKGKRVEDAKAKDLFYRSLNDTSIKKHLETATDILIVLLQRNKPINLSRTLKNLIVNQMLRPKVTSVNKSEFEVLLQSEIRTSNKSFEIRSAKEFEYLSSLKKGEFIKRKRLTLETHLLDDELIIVTELLNSLFNEADFKNALKNLS